MASTISAGTTTTTALVYSADTSGVLQLQTNGGTTAVTIDTNQNVGVGVTPSAWSSSWSGKIIQLGYGTLAGYSDARLEFFNNCYVNTSGNVIYSTTQAATVYAMGASGGTHQWFNAPSGTAGTTATLTQAMTLDSSGNLLVGTTSATSRLSVYDSTAGSTVSDIRNTAATGNPCILYPRMTVTGTTSNYFFAGQANGTDNVYIYGNGNIVNRNNSYGTLSDIKLKENIVDTTPKLADIMRLQVRNFNLKENPENKQIGFIAQELEQVFPTIVDESPDRDVEGNILESTTKSIKTSVLIPILVKAIQEQQAMITNLQAQVTTLQTQVTALKG